MKIIGLLCLFALGLFDCGDDSGREPAPMTDAGEACSAFNCEGCCTDDGRCVDGLSTLACGSSGDRCVECSSPAMCGETGVGGGTCEMCNPFNCDGCCDETDTCRSGTDDLACGHAGRACTACEGVALCDPRGTGGGICR